MRYFRLVFCYYYYHLIWFSITKQFELLQRLYKVWEQRPLHFLIKESFGQFSSRTVDLVTYELYFIATIKNKSLSGVYAIGLLNEDMGDFLDSEEHGVITGGTLGPHIFNLTGTETFDDLCSHCPSPIAMSINGHIPSDWQTAAQYNSKTQKVRSDLS